MKTVWMIAITAGILFILFLLYCCIVVGKESDERLEEILKYGERK